MVDLIGTARTISRTNNLESIYLSSGVFKDCVSDDVMLLIALPLTVYFFIIDVLLLRYLNYSYYRGRSDGDSAGDIQDQ